MGNEKKSYVIDKSKKQEKKRAKKGKKEAKKEEIDAFYLENPSTTLLL